MLQKWKQREFGTCPRVLCDQHPLLPIGLDDIPGRNTVRCYQLYGKHSTIIHPFPGKNVLLKL